MPEHWKGKKGPYPTALKAHQAFPVAHPFPAAHWVHSINQVRFAESIPNNPHIFLYRAQTGC